MKKFKVAGYLRLSNDDGDKFESNSIASQRVMLENYINGHDDMELVECFVDDGFTGTNFNRPEVKRMFQAIEDGKINCVIVKDLSRFGRDYIDVGNYLERYFPANDIRFIAINDAYDSGNSSASDDFMMPLKNVINAHYSKDISKKVKSAFKAKQSNGDFVGAFASYGYIKAQNNKHQLIIDEEAAITVRRIFNMYNEGVGKISIAKILNEEGIPCPSEYKRLKGMNYKNCNRLEYTAYWTYSTIHRILSNEMYIGNMVQNKSVRKMVHGNAKKLDEKDWIKVAATHEPIIEMDLWNSTQELLKKRTRQMDFDSEVGLFSGFIRCGDCGRAFSKVRRHDEIYYICGSYKRYSKNICYSHYVKESVLEKLILDELNKEFAKVDEIEAAQTEKKKIHVDKTPYQIRLQQIYRLKKELYEDLKQGILEKAEYEAYKEDYQREENMLNGQLAAIDNSSNEEDKVRNEWVEKLKKYHQLDKLDRAMLACILEPIIVFENDKEKRIEVKLKYTL